MAVDWTAIKAEYITTQTSYRKLAEKYGVSRDLVADKGKEEEWVELRRQHSAKILSKAVEKNSQKKADQLARIDRVTDRLLTKIERAVDELDIHLATNTRKEKVIEYDNQLRPDKPTKETITEVEEILQVASIIDRAGLRQITAALRDIKEIKMLISPLDEEEKKARIEALRRQNDKETTGKEPITIEIGEGLDIYCK